MSLTQQLTGLLRSKAVTDEVVQTAALFVLDTLACAYAARATPQGRILLDWYRSTPGDASRRAFLFGALAHVLEIDDLHRESVTHPGCVVIPSAWWAASKRDHKGYAFLVAVALGYETMCRIGNAVGPKHYEIWHNTATCGPYGAATAATAMIGLGEEQAVWALGNAGTQSSGLWQFLEDGAMSKHLHAGRAAESGLLAAELAQRDFTGPSQILEGSKGFFAAACPDADPGKVLANPDGPWQILQTSVKPWPCCRHTHPAIDAALDLSGEINAEQIDRISIATYRAATELCDNAQPESAYEAQFSLQHCTAAALADGEVSFSSFNPGTRERLGALRDKVTVAIDETLDAAYPARWGVRIRIGLANGQEASAERTACKGDPELPIPQGEWVAKCKELFEYGNLGSARAQRIVDAVLALPGNGPLPSIETLYA